MDEHSEETTEVMEYVEPPREIVTRSILAGLDETTPQETMAELRNRIDAQLALLRDIDKSFKETEAVWINANGPFLVGDGVTRRLVIEKKTVNPDKKGTLEAVFEACGGDMEAVAETLGSGAFKLGACKGVLGDRWKDFFTETVEEVPETKKPKKSVQTVNERFLQAAMNRKEAARHAAE